MIERCSRPIRSGSFARLHRVWLTAALFGLTIALSAPRASAQLRVVTYNIAQLQGDTTALTDVIVEMHADDSHGFAVPVSVIVFQEVKQINLGTIANRVNTAAPSGVSYQQGTYTNNGEDPVAGAQAMFFNSDLLAEITAEHADIFTGAGRQSDRWKFKLLGYDDPEVFFYVYSSHLKATNEDEALRLAGVQALRTNADALPGGSHIIFAGDMNFYSNTEDGYLEFKLFGNTTGFGRVFDPLGSGSWFGTSNAIKHTQSPRTVDDGSGLITGGLDDRFDFQLPTLNWDDGDGLFVIPGTYRTLGNDGVHYNQAISSGNNFYFPGELVRSFLLAVALHDTTDHLPVICDYAVPGIIEASMATDFGRVIQDAAYSLPFQIENLADVVDPAAADAVTFFSNGSGALVGNPSDTVAALAGPETFFVGVDTSTVGPASGSLILVSIDELVQNASQTLDTQGVVVRPAEASFSDSVKEDGLLLEATFAADTGVQQIDVDVHNLGFDALQALLDVDAVSAVSPPFAFTGGAGPGIGATPATLTFTFDTTGLADDVYTAPVIIDTSDEDLPGEAVSQLALQLSVTVSSGAACAADVNGDTFVNTDDFLAVLSSWGACPPPCPPTCQADTNGDCVVNTDDFLAVLSNWGPCIGP